MLPSTSSISGRQGGWDRLCCHGMCPMKLNLVCTSHFRNDNVANCKLIISRQIFSTCVQYLLPWKFLSSSFRKDAELEDTRTQLRDQSEANREWLASKELLNRDIESKDTEIEQLRKTCKTNETVIQWLVSTCIEYEFIYELWWAWNFSLGS